MARRIRNEFGWEHKAREDVTLSAKLLGIVRNARVKMNQARLATFVKAEMIKDYEIRAEQDKAKSIEFLLRRTLIMQ